RRGRCPARDGLTSSSPPREKHRAFWVRQPPFRPAPAADDPPPAPPAAAAIFVLVVARRSRAAPAGGAVGERPDGPRARARRPTVPPIRDCQPAHSRLPSRRDRA